MKIKVTVLSLCAMLYALCSSAHAQQTKENPPDRIAIRYLLYQGPRGAFPPGAARAWLRREKEYHR